MLSKHSRQSLSHCQSGGGGGGPILTRVLKHLVAIRAMDFNPPPTQKPEVKGRKEGREKREFV